MAAIATLEELKAVEADLARLRDQHPDAYQAIAALLRTHRKVGYKNIAKMLLGETTPEKLKASE